MTVSHHDAKMQRARKALIGAIIFCLVFMICEVIFGVMAHSLALITDAMHLLTDVAALSLSLFATVVSQWAGSKRLSFGWHRAEVVGAMCSVFLVWALAGVIIYEACNRISTMIKCAKREASACDGCEGIESVTMFAVGCAGFFVNVICAGILMAGGHAHSHGGLPGGAHTCTGGHGHGGGHDDDHGHAMVETPKNANAHGHSHDGKPAFGDHHDCDHDDDHGHSHGGNGSGGNQRDTAPLLVNDGGSYGGCGHGHDHQDHGHSHDHHAAYDNDDDHGHAHGGHDNETNMNIRGAMIHAIGDCVQSIGVIIAASIIWGTNGRDKNPHAWSNLADPICSLIFAAVTLYTTRFLTVDVFYVLMEATPDSVKLEELHEALSGISQVTQVDHLHVWALTPSLKSMSVHVVCPSLQHHMTVLRDAKVIAKRFGIGHTTVQVDVERESTDAAHSSSPLCVTSAFIRAATGGAVL
jgi:zinc transporter 2